MALSFFPKINRFLIQNLSKAFYSKKSEPAITVQKFGESSSTHNEEIKTQVFPPATVLQSARGGASERLDSEAKLLQKNLQMHQLQPAFLPKYYKSPVDVQSGIFPTASEASHQPRRLEQSVTYKNVKLPLKKPRLANPFPEPVKVMESDIVSDQEKAAQMQASARVPTSTEGQSSSGMAGFSQSRSYSTSGACKKKSKKSKCTKIKSNRCKPRKRKSCDVEYAHKPCKKQAAPYPSYSESCHKALDRPPSECRICPYNPEKHPGRKSKKKKSKQKRK